MSGLIRFILHQQLIEVAAARSELIALDAHLLEQRDEEIAQRCLLAAILWEEEMMAVLEAPAREHHGQVRVGMCAGIAHAAAEDHGGVVQQRAPTDVLHGGEPLQEVIQLRHQRRLDDVQLPQLVRVLT